MRKPGLALFTAALVLVTAALAPAAFAAGTYSEVWNPPEARATAPHRVGAHQLAVRRHVGSRARQVYSRRTSATAPRLVAKQGNVPKSLPRSEPGMSDIPRQITPEGNVLRVTGHAASAHVVR